MQFGGLSCSSGIDFEECLSCYVARRDDQVRLVIPDRLLTFQGVREKGDEYRIEDIDGSGSTNGVCLKTVVGSCGRVATTEDWEAGDTNCA